LSSGLINPPESNMRSFHHVKEDMTDIVDNSLDMTEDNLGMTEDNLDTTEEDLDVIGTGPDVIVDAHGAGADFDTAEPADQDNALTGASADADFDTAEPADFDTAGPADQDNALTGASADAALIEADFISVLNSLPSFNNDRLFYLYRDSHDISIRNEIVGRHMYLIDIITRKFINRGVEYEDLCQIASIALIKAVERFDLEKGVKFVSFATPTIVGEIKRYFRDKGSTIRIPRRIYEIYQKVNQAKEYLSQSLSRTPMVSDIAEYLKISEENVLEIIESWNVYNIQSFEQNAFSEDNLELHETIGEDDFEFEKIENRDFIEKSMAKLSESEREFINLRYMNDMTQKQIAAVMNVSQMYISRLEKKIIRKFRMILEK